MVRDPGWIVERPMSLRAHKYVTVLSLFTPCKPISSPRERERERERERGARSVVRDPRANFHFKLEVLRSGRVFLAFPPS